MQINWTFGRKLAAGFAIAVLTLVVIGIAGYKSTAHLIENDRWVAHTHEVRTRLVSLSIPLTEAESAARAFASSPRSQSAQSLTSAGFLERASSVGGGGACDCAIV